MASLDIMSLFEFDIAAFGEGKEVEMSKKNQKVRCIFCVPRHTCCAACFGRA